MIRMASEFASPQVEEQKELENLIKDLKGSLRPFLSVSFLCCQWWE